MAKKKQANVEGLKKIYNTLGINFFYLAVPKVR